MAEPTKEKVRGMESDPSPAMNPTPDERGASRFTLQEELFAFCGLMLFTCFFLPWHIGEVDVSPSSMLASSTSAGSVVGWILLLGVYGLNLASVRRPRVRPWLGIVTLAATLRMVASIVHPPEPEAYGADWALLFALGLMVLSVDTAVATAGDLAMRRLNSQSAEVFTHWGTVLPGIHFSAQEFYAKVETEVRARQWPGVEFLRVSHREAGILSHNREYLRIVRQRQVFDVCAASFGRDYFFTLREAEVRAQLTLATLIIFFLVLLVFLSLLINTVGFVFGLACFGVLLLVGILVLFSVLRMGLTRLDGLLMRTPIIGPVYETWFRRSTTYFQHDARVVFVKLMDDLVKAHVDEETSAQGVQMLSCFEHQPILDGFYKTSTHPTRNAEGK